MLKTTLIAGAALAATVAAARAADAPRTCQVALPAGAAGGVITVETRPAYAALEVTQARFERASQDVVVRDGHTRYVVTEPEFREEVQQVVVRPAYERLVVEPAQFAPGATVVQVRAPRLVWRTGALSPVTRTDARTGEVYSLVEEPGANQVVGVQTLVRPETVRREMAPAETRPVRRQVLARPASVREIAVPPQTQPMIVQRVAAAASVRETQVPAQTAAAPVTASAGVAWVDVVCDDALTRPLVASIQRALRGQGLYGGALDGVFGPASRTGLAAFQRRQGLPGAGLATLESLDRLGVTARAAAVPGAPARATARVRSGAMAVSDEAGPPLAAAPLALEPAASTQASPVSPMAARPAPRPRVPTLAGGPTPR